MKTPAKVTQDVRRRVFALKADGRSLRQTKAVLEAEGVSLSVQGIADVLKGAEPGPDGVRAVEGTGRGPTPVRVRVGVQGGGSAGESPITEPPADASPYARDLYARLKDTERRMGEIPRDDERSYAAAYASILRAFTALLERYHKALPKPEVDPSKDPHSIAARAMILQRVTSTIEAVKARARKAGYRFPGDQ